MRFVITVLVLLSIPFTGCVTDADSLVVELRTDYAPGTELASIETDLLTTTGHNIRSNRREVYEGEDALRGITAGAFSDLSPGTYRVVLRLLDPRGNTLAVRPATIDFRHSQAVTLVVTRTCGELSCGLDEACFDGRCVADSCTAQTPAACGASSCSRDDECGECGLCAAGACLVADAAMCELPACTEPGGCVEPPPVRSDCFMIIDENIVTDTVIEAGCVVRVPGHISVEEGAHLTVEPGVRFEMGPDAKLTIGAGWSCSEEDCGGGIIARGTAEAPIEFTSESAFPAPGDWVGIEFEDDTLGPSELSHVRIMYAGRDGASAIELTSSHYHTAGAVRITDSLIAHNAAGGLRATYALAPVNDLFGEVSGNTFADNGDYSFILSANAVASISDDNELDAPILITENNDLLGPSVWPDLGQPYVLENSLDLYSADALWIPPPGARILMLGGQIRVRNGGIRAIDVTFESGLLAPLGGDWEGITFDSGAGASVFDSCTFRHAGSGCTGEYCGVIYLYDVDQRVSIERSTFADNIGMRDIRGGAASSRCAEYMSSAAANEFDLTPCE